MPTVLVTGVRAPSALELCRHFAAEGWRVVAADSLAFPLGRFSRTVACYHRLPPPRQRPREFAARVLALVHAERPALIVPACEEVFHLAPLHAELPAGTRLFAETPERLRTLHHKADFLELARGCGAEIPPGALVHDRRDLAAAFSAWPELVLKPVYSRFASRTLIRPAPTRAAQMLARKPEAWLAQQFIAGEEVCSTSIAHDGVLAAHVCYRPRLRAGRGASVYFEPQKADDVRGFVDTFVSRERITGQIAFDFIRTGDGRLFVLECNPRATSGAHLFVPGALAAAITRGEKVEPLATSAKVGLACATFALPQLLRERRPLALLRVAREVVSSSRDPWPFALQLLGVAELAARAVRHRCGLLAASTLDIEWNGPSP